MRADTWIAIGCGLGAATCFGTGDFLAQRLTHRHGWMPAMFAVQLASVLVLALVGVAWHGSGRIDLAGIGEIAAIGLVNTLGMIGLYRAFESGKLSLVSPIAGSMGAFTVGFAWVAGDPAPVAVIPGLVTVVLGILAASVVVTSSVSASPKLGRALGIGWALMSAIGFGWVFLMLGSSSVALGPAWTIAIVRVVAIVSLLLLAIRQGPSLVAALRPTADQPHSRGRTLAVAVLDSAGMVFVAVGSSRGAVAGETAVVAVLASSFPLITIAFARVWLREALQWWQWIGVGLVVVGVAWVSALA